MPSSPSPWVCTLSRGRPSRRPRNSSLPTLERSLASESKLQSSISRSSARSPHGSIPRFDSATEEGFEDADALDEDMDKTTEDLTDGEEDEVDGADDDGTTSPLSTANSLSSIRLCSSNSLPLEACTVTSCWRYRMYSTDCSAGQTHDVCVVLRERTLRRIIPLLALIVVCSLAFACAEVPLGTDGEAGDNRSPSSLGSFFTIDPSSGKSGNPSSVGKTCIPIRHPIRKRIEMQRNAITHQSRPRGQLQTGRRGGSVRKPILPVAWNPARRGGHRTRTRRRE